MDLTNLAREVGADADFEAQNAGRGVRVEFLGPEQALEVRGDGELLRRALENVARNATRHTRENSAVKLSLRRQNDEIVWTARDFGPGVPENELTAIFQPFHRVEAARERENTDGGTGLGLAIAERAARAHGGEISARNARDGGLEVEISLPALK